MRLIHLTPLLLALTGCGSYVLGYVQPQVGKTDQDRQTDMLICKDQAKIETDTDARVAGSFVAGLTIVGAPIAIAAAREKEREVFARCMNAKGYQVRPAT